MQVWFGLIIVRELFLILGGLMIMADVVTGAAEQPLLRDHVLPIIFGTENGYDRGGPDPMCWRSQFPAPSPNATSKSSPTAWNNLLWESLTANHNDTSVGTETSTTTIELLRQCSPGTRLLVQPILQQDEDSSLRESNETMYTEIITTFVIELSLNATSTNATKAFVRLQFCNAWQFGFCNPIPLIRHSMGVVEKYKNDDVTTTSDSNVFIEQTETGGRIALSKWTRIRFDRNDQNIRRGRTTLYIQLPQSIQTGAYHVVAHAFVIDEMDDTTATISRLDIAQPISGNIMMVQNPPILLEVTRTTKIIMGVAIGLCGMFALALFLFLLVHRHHAAMRLAQGSFLSAIAFGCLVQIVFSFVLFPTRDVYCRLIGVLCLLPMTFVASCMVGRIWRVYRTLAKVNQFGRNRQQQKRSIASATGDSVVSALTSIANLPFLAQERRETRLHRQSGVRQSISAKETASLITALTMPQLILQVLAATLADRELVLDTDSTGAFQRQACGEDGRWAAMVGTVYVALVCMLAVGLAWVSRDLPSAFNEKDQVYRAASLSIFSTFVGIALSEHLHNPTTHPDVAVILLGAWALLVPMSVLTMIVFPKVQRVLSGEKVVISNMVGGRFSMQQPVTEAQWQVYTGAETTSNGHRPEPITNESRKISLAVDDPLPQHLEGLLFGVQNVLRGVTKKIAQGRAPSPLDLTRLGEEVALLSDELAIVDFVNSLQTTPTSRRALPCTKEEENPNAPRIPETVVQGTLINDELSRRSVEI